MSANSRFAMAIHILTLLALEDGPFSSKQIAASVNTNPVFIRRILGILSRAGLVTTHQGVGGGSRLARAADRINLKEVYGVTEQGSLFSLPHSQPDARCPCGRHIQSVLTHSLQAAEAAMESVLASTTIAQVAQDILECQDQA